LYKDCFFYRNQLFLPLEKIKHYEMCSSEDEVLEVFKLSWQGAPLKYECKQVFSYRYFFTRIDIFGHYCFGMPLCLL
jgi:hypothetical protein